MFIEIYNLGLFYRNSFIIVILNLCLFVCHVSGAKSVQVLKNELKSPAQKELLWSREYIREVGGVQRRSSRSIHISSCAIVCRHVSTTNRSKSKLPPNSDIEKDQILFHFNNCNGVDDWRWRSSRFKCTIKMPAWIVCVRLLHITNILVPVSVLEEANCRRHVVSR